MNFDNMQLFFERHYDDVMQDGSLYIRKGQVAKLNKYKVVINAGDHEPPHIHISVNNRQIGSYLISNGDPYRVYHQDFRIDGLVKLWFKNDNNKIIAEKEWHRLGAK